MRLKYWVTVLVFFLLLLFFSSSTQAQLRQRFGEGNSRNTVSMILSQAQNSETASAYEFKFGSVDDSEPVSSNDRLERYCDALFSELEVYGAKKVSVKYNKRFQHHDGIIIECGPNSITSERIKDLKNSELNGDVNGYFSEPFFRTETKIIIRNSKRKLLTQKNPSLASFEGQSDSSFKVGVIKDTTNEGALKSIYPTAILKEVENRTEAIQHLKSSMIDAYISDEVLLPSILNKLPPGEFSIEPKLYGFTNEYYGIVIYDDPKSPYSFKKLKEKVNTWINSEKGQKEREKLEREIDYSATSRALNLFISSNTLYNIPPFVLLFLMLLFPIILLFFIIWLFSCVVKISLFSPFLKWFRSRWQNNNKITHIVNIFVSRVNNTLIPLYIDRNAVFILLRGIGNPLLQANNQNIHSNEEVKKKVAENLLSEAESDPYFLKVLKALLGVVKDVTIEEIDKWLENVIDPDNTDTN